MNENYTETQEAVVNPQMGTPSQEVYNPMKHAIDNVTALIREEILEFKREHPGAGKKIFGASLLAAGATVLII